jgi:hypothetical protein
VDRTLGNGLRALGGCALVCMIGMMQWTCKPTPSRAAPGVKPALSQAILICLQGP